MPVSRFGVSLDEEQLQALDQYVLDNAFPNRSKAISYIIEKSIVEKKWQCNNIVAGAIILQYDHHKREISNTLADVQHNYHDIIMSSQHFHLSPEKCLDIIAVKGPSHRLTELSDKLISIKGILHGKLAMSRAD